MSEHDDTLMKYYGNIVYPDGKLCIECKKMKQRFDYTTDICNKCYIKITAR